MMFFSIKNAKNVYKKTKNAIKKWKFNIHPLFVIMFIISILIGTYLELSILVTLAIIHELSHLIVAKKFGYTLNKIVLMPYGAELHGDDIFFGNHEFWIVVVGPLINFLISAISLSIIWIFPETYNVSFMIFKLSLILACFNLLPFFPLDGGRILLWALTKKISRKNAIKISKICSICFAFILFLLFFVSIFGSININYGIVAVMIFASVFAGDNQCVYEKITFQFAKKKRLGKGLQERVFVVSNDSTLIDLFMCLNNNYFCKFVVFDNKNVEIFHINEFDLMIFLEKFDSSVSVFNAYHKMQG